MSLRSSLRVSVVLPALAALIVFFVVPLIGVVITSFHVESPHGVTNAWTVANLGTGLQPYYFDGLIRSIWISAVVTAIAIAAGFPIAAVYVHARGFSRFGLTLALFLPLVISSVVTAYGWIILLGSNGVITVALHHLGLLHSAIGLLYTPIGDIVALEEWVIPFAVLPIATALAGIDPDLYHAGASLGARRIRLFYNVTLPLARGGLVGGGVMAYALSMSSYITPQLVGGGRVRVLPLMIYDQFMTLFNRPLGSALAVLLMLVVLIPVAAFVRGNVFAGVKTS